jgi:hypothetical protein
MYEKGTVVQVVEPVDFERWDCVMHRSYVVESAVDGPARMADGREIHIEGETFEPFYFLNNDVPGNGEEHDGAAYTAPAWAVMRI